MAPVLAAKPWGGRRLAQYGKQLPDDGLVGESWEIADLPADRVTTVADPRSRVAAGRHAGKSLHELIEQYGSELLGSVSPTAEGDFPLLVKLLDARENLSVQVHPDAAYVADHPDAWVKEESWYVVAADPGTRLFLGLLPDVTAGDVAAAVGSGGVVDLLRSFPAHAGDFHHLPAGLVHALGAGVLVAEVQTPSDTTFRIDDWDDLYNRPPRQMHTAEALEALRPRLTSIASSPAADPGIRDLPCGELYWMREHVVSTGAVTMWPQPELRVVMVVRGEIRLDGLPCPPGTTVVAPAAIAADLVVSAAGPAVLLEIGLS